AQWYEEPIVPAKDLFASMQSMAPFIRISSGWGTASSELPAICNDWRLPAWGRKTGSGELFRPAVQPAPSFIPGKGNPAAEVMEKDKLMQVLDPLPMTKGGVQ